MDKSDNILELRGITKKFPGVIALHDVDLDIKAGEVHVLVGENGAGKSSLIKVLCGIYMPDEGTMRYQGQPYLPQTPHKAMEAGIRVVYQEFNLLSYLSVAENIFFDDLPRRCGLVDFKTLYRKTQALLDLVGLDISPKTPVELLGVAQMQLIEIAKAISSDSKVLILDEPTATLSSKEIDMLFGIVAKLKAKGVTIIFISHHLQEVFDIGDRISVLRNGANAGTHVAADITIPEIVKLMVGRSMDEEYPFKDDVPVGETMFSVEGLRCKGGRHSVSFAVGKGELLGIAGLVGSGRTDAVRAIFGADAKESGTVTLHGKTLDIRNPRDAVENGICLLTEDRKNQGLILEMSCAVNTTITDLPGVAKYGFIQKDVEREVAEKLAADLDIKTPSVDQWVGNLSGGNQQKVVLAKWLYRNAEVLIFDEPTRGIDVGAKYEIYLLLWKLAAAGKAIIIVSSDLPEMLGICHRIITFSDGKITGELGRGQFDQERILALAYEEYIQNDAPVSSGNA
ncbi:MULTISPECIES: sugar ABC transporter ATP-binding protein [unclassified Pseudodesulfovibrio]|uniref:sugar ABC transporter ATP-binding protein n=1 Tax=unclassified Pseudodesulfovibrio TaxID=2661612 RepID=UPI000FEB661F|nr:MULTISPECIES: sugar ABC transporter ATP-binding protein [unclassified Pseudodesulfovibrio]MCJ2164712.1 sugar ABC transporter ATP-binding protein [Pseudodesulfovibrio sp. S3-i]RWU04099.1 sugar ABC transporter ATP-binding protein [Pseudodesulfovibrio sp. S3]